MSKKFKQKICEEEEAKYLAGSYLFDNETEDKLIILLCNISLILYFCFLTEKIFCGLSMQLTVLNKSSSFVLFC
jgi:hypothetical protein